MPGDYTRIHRLLKILTLIQSQTGWTARRLAEHCGTTERNIYRDLKSLEGAGIPYSFDDETRGYRVQKGFFMPPVSLTAEESLALLALAEHIGGKEQIPFTRAAGRAIRKIRCTLPAAMQNELEKLEEHVSIQLAATSAADGPSDVYETICEAISRRRKLECTYEAPGQNGGDHEQPFLFAPYTLFYSQRAWYAVGAHQRRRGVRSLKLARFTSCRVSDLPYDIPRDFSMAGHLGNAWRMIRGDTSYEVALRFDAGFGDTVEETQWHATQETQWQEDGSLLFTCTVDGLDEIVWWVLSMGPHCRVINPPELAQRVADLARQTAAHYEKAAPSVSGKPRGSAR